MGFGAIAPSLVFASLMTLAAMAAFASSTVTAVVVDDLVSIGWSSRGLTFGMIRTYVCLLGCQLVGWPGLGAICAFLDLSGCDGVGGCDGWLLRRKATSSSTSAVVGRREATAAVWMASGAFSLPGFTANWLSFEHVTNDLSPH